MSPVSLRTALRIARAGHPRERLRVIRDGQATLRVATVQAALQAGVLAALRTPRTPTELARELGAGDLSLLRAFVGTLAAHGLVTTSAGALVLTRRGRAVLADDVVRAGYEGFGGFHSDLYRSLPEQLRGGPGRRDVERHGEVIARLSRAMEPLVQDALTALVHETPTGRVMDVGCGDGALLVHLLTTLPRATGVGVEVDDAAADLAEAAVAAAGLTDRATVHRGDVRELLTAPGAVGGPVDLLLLANVIYYVPAAGRTAFVRSLAELIAPGGHLVVVSTVAEASAFSRHFDLLLQAQHRRMRLPTPDDLAATLAAAGLEVRAQRRVVPGDPLHIVTARRPG